jgi:hypothetical protein
MIADGGVDGPAQNSRIRDSGTTSPSRRRSRPRSPGPCALAACGRSRTGRLESARSGITRTTCADPSSGPDRSSPPPRPRSPSSAPNVKTSLNPRETRKPSHLRESQEDRKVVARAALSQSNIPTKSPQLRLVRAGVSAVEAPLPSASKRRYGVTSSTSPSSGGCYGPNWSDPTHKGARSAGGAWARLPRGVRREGLERGGRH